ncbi:sensor histidine kinase [Nocardiopsis prasina]|uniref:sensor histidine kinase n=1 Tax=Nocardiopsis prasina TaxID=2015 RepID=UPI000346C5DF|nr:sensor histidine kinase [Nocardiopsis prasina]
MRKKDSLPDLSSWVALRADRPPRVLNLLFWAAVISTGLTYGFVFLVAPELFPSGDPLVDVVIVVIIVCLVVSCALWPLLAWSPSAGWGHRAASVLFLAVSVFSLASNNYTVLVLVCLATMNAIAVFGIAGACGYGAFLGGVNFLLVLLVPGDPLLIGLVTTGSSLVLVLASGLVYVALLVASQRAERTRELLAELEEAHAELGRHAERVRELTVSEERARMSREMHDSTGHYLTALAMTLSNASRFRTARPEAAWEEVEQARELARDALTDTRRWVRALRPLQLEGKAGTTAMRAMADSFDGGGARIVFTDAGAWPRLSQEAELVCYRALQEGLTNAMRHSGGDRIEVEVGGTAEGACVSVTDNGTGAEEGAARGGFGLRGLRERVASVDGSMSTENPPGGGFRLLVNVPAGSGADSTVPVMAGGAG